MSATTTDRPTIVTTAGVGRGALTYLSVELRRLLRNRRTAIFTLVMPAVFFLIFGTASEYRTLSAAAVGQSGDLRWPGAGHGNVTAYVMVSMALYGAMLAATSAGATVSVERAQGWSRQLRLTPLRPAVYVATKIAVAMVLGLVGVAIVYGVGAARGAEADASAWALTALAAWLGSIVFAAFGLFMGYLLPAENVMQILSPVLAVLSFAGGLFVPLGDGLFATVAQLIPTYGLAELVRAPLTGGGVTLAAVANVLVWAAVFVGGAAWLFRRDTARV